MFDCVGRALFKKQCDVGGEQGNCNPKWDFYGPLKESSSPLDHTAPFPVAGCKGFLSGARVPCCRVGSKRGRCSGAGAFALTPQNFYWAPQNPQTAVIIWECRVQLASGMVTSQAEMVPAGIVVLVPPPRNGGRGCSHCPGCCSARGKWVAHRFYKISDLLEISGFRQFTWKLHQDAGGERLLRS